MVNSTNFIDVTDYSLKIKYLRTEDSGRYDCVGENMGGAVTVSLEVTRGKIFSVYLKIFSVGGVWLG